VTGSVGSSKLALTVYLSLLATMFAFALFAGHANQGLLELSPAGRNTVGIGIAVGVALSLHLANFSGDRLRVPTQRGLRLSIGFVVLAGMWALACFLTVHRAALLLDGPVSTETGRLKRPLFAGPPLWCAYFTTVSTGAGYPGAICMQRLADRSQLVPLLGCVPLDSPATVRITQTWLGPVGSLVEIPDTGKCRR
jgi:hypothetical protein